MLPVKSQWQIWPGHTEPFSCGRFELRLSAGGSCGQTNRKTGGDDGTDENPFGSRAGIEHPSEPAVKRPETSGSRSGEQPVDLQRLSSRYPP